MTMLLLGAGPTGTLVQPSVPTVTSLTPNNGTHVGGTSVVLAGTSFTRVTAVFFDTTSATFVINSDIQITATSPAHAAGATNVTVKAPAGISATGAGNVYTYT